MKIGVIGAAGKQGKRIVEEALKQGYEVTAIVRDKSKITNPEVKVIEKDLFVLTYEDIKEQEVIVDAFAAWTTETFILHQTSLQHLADILSGRPNRLFVVGGAGSLYVNPEQTVRLVETPEFPEMFKPLAGNMASAFAALQVRKDVNWTYVSPAAEFDIDGKRTGRYILGEDNLIVNAGGESYVSYADYAIALVDEIRNKAFVGKRFTVVSERG